MQDSSIVLVGSDMADSLPFGCVATSTSLTIPQSISRSDWAALIHSLQFSLEAKGAEIKMIKFWLSDGLEFGEKKWREDYAQVIEERGYADQTVYNIQWVGNKVAPSRRRENPRVTFEHHATVAAMLPEQQDHWLERAETDGLSVKALRREIQHTADRGNDKEPVNGDAERLLRRALAAVSAALPETWADMIVAELVGPLKLCAPEVEYESFLATLSFGIQELLEGKS